MFSHLAATIPWSLAVLFVPLGLSPRVGCGAESSAGRTDQRPNILWITAEDLSPNLGCYGDRYATTPHLDRLAERGVRYTHAFATAPVCSPARSCLITGLYATSLGTANLRSEFPIPSHVRGFPAYLRQQAGYFCTNNQKTDYNTAQEPALIRACWDECSGQAHWRHRKSGQPFFSVFNLMVTHQSRTSAWPYEEFEGMIEKELEPAQRHDPAQAPVPPFYPDTPVVRRSLARYYDCITAMDRQVGQLLDQLTADGLADDTIVFFYGDNGMGMPRGKRTLYDSGLHEPLLLYVPEKFRHLAPARAGQAVDRLVSFVDFGPTVLNLAGVEVPDYMQGTAFLGPGSEDTAREYVYGARDRVDEAYDVARSVRDSRYLYIRNYRPHWPWHQPETFSDTAEIRQEISRLAQSGQLNDAQRTYAGADRPREELFDTLQDPYQVHNLAASPEHQAVLVRLRRAHRQWLSDTRDVGFLPESELWARLEGRTPWDIAHIADCYPLEPILSAAELVGLADAVSGQRALLRHPDAGVRFWAAVGLRGAGTAARGATTELHQALADPSASVRLEAAAVLAQLGEADAALPLLVKELHSEQLDDALHAARTLQLMGPAAQPAVGDLRSVLRRVSQAKSQAPQYLFLQFSLKTALDQLKETR